MSGYHIHGTMADRRLSAALFSMVLAYLMFASACGPNPRIMNSIEEKRESAPANRPVLTVFEADLEAMRTADFTYIYVLRRKDGGEMSADDRSFVNQNTPVETNRRKISDEGRAIILGTNFEFEDKLLEALKDRFAFEDHSKPPPKPEKEDVEQK